MSQSKQMPKPTPKEEAMILHPAEVSLLLIIRRMKFGTITQISVQNGLPVYVSAQAQILQKIDLTKEEEVRKLLSDSLF